MENGDTVLAAALEAVAKLLTGGNSLGLRSLGSLIVVVNDVFHRLRSQE